MLHAKPGPGLARRALPVLLLSASTAAFGGLVALAPGEEPAPAVLAYTDTRVVPLDELSPALEERAVARASRSRRLDEQERARAAAAAKAAAEAKAKADAAARAAADRAAAEGKAKAAAKAKAEADAKAKAQAAARAAAARSRAAAVPTRIAGRCPVPNATFTDTWGAARSGGRSHRGTDLLAPYGSPVYAVASGVVRTASSSAGGISLYLRADNGETYFYAHNAANLVRTGQRVAAGQLIARVGSTGNAGNTNHVHFEREVGGRSVNPYAFLRRLC